MPDDWRERYRSWLHPDSYAHPNSPAGGSGTGFSRTPGSTGYSWSPLPDPNSPAGRFIHLQTEIWALEQRERDEIARHVEELETSLAKHSDNLRQSIPDGYLRTLYDRQVGRTKGTYDFAKSLISTGVDATLLLQKLTSPVGWLDPDVQRKLQHGYSFGVAVSKVYVKWEFGTLQEKKQVLHEAGALAKRVYDEAKNSIQRQWADAKRTGKQEELIERWKTRLLLEVGTLAVGAGELRGASAAGREIEAGQLLEDKRLLQVGKTVETAKSEAVPALQGVVQGQEIPKSPVPPSSPLVPGGGLTAHEAAGGHLLDKHVGETYEDLATRLAKEPRIDAASSFTDRATAEKAVAETINANQAKITDWLASGRNTPLPISHTMSEPVGISVPRGVPVGIPASSVKVILVRDASFPDGYRILTGYPEL
jgi:hypothetical protein